MDPIRLAFVGCGGIAGAHVRGLKELWEQHRRRMESGPGCWNRSLESLDPVGSRMESVDS